MEPEFSLPRSQGTTTGPFSVLDESSPHPRIFLHVGVQYFCPIYARVFKLSFLF
jgi:hypothetical protein